MYFILFVFSVMLMSLTLHTNRVPFNWGWMWIVLAASAIPVLNVLMIVVCLAELGYIRFVIRRKNSKGVA